MAKVKIEYFTDPLYSYCFAFEPLLQRLIEEHGYKFELEYRFGGLLPNWDGFMDEGNGISSPKDVAEHWEHVGDMTGVPINGDVWLNDPISSSYPASIACIAVKHFGNDLFERYLKKVRQKAFVKCKNIAKESVLCETAVDIGIDEKEFLYQYHSAKATSDFELDLKYASEKGVNVFPTLLFCGTNKTFVLEGFLPYDKYVKTLDNVN